MDDVVLQTVVPAEAVDEITGRAWGAGVTGVAEEPLGDGRVRISVACPVEAQAAVTLALGGDVDAVESWTVVVKRVDVPIEGKRLGFDVPANVFGDGAHPTTAMCLALVPELVRDGDHVLDLGCGSGILTVAAARRGARVEALDVWAPAVETTRANTAAHDCADRVRARVGSVESTERDHDVVFANIGAATLVELADRIAPLVRRTLVLSGVLESQADQVLEAYPDLTEERRVIDDGWVTVVLGPV